MHSKRAHCPGGTWHSRRSHHESKQQLIDLATQLINAQQGRDDGEMVIVRSGRAFMKVRAFNAGSCAEVLKNAHRKQRSKPELRCYPKFTPGMSTAEYVVKFAAANGVAANVLPFDLSQYAAPGALYENGALDLTLSKSRLMNRRQCRKWPKLWRRKPRSVYKPQASPSFAALIRAARDAKRIARQAIAQASASSAQSVPDDTDGNPYPYLQPIADTQRRRRCSKEYPARP